MRRLALVLVVACTRPVAEPVEPEPVTPAATVTTPPDAPPATPSIIRARILAIEVDNGDVIAKLAVGTDHGVSKEWTGCLLRGDTDHCLAGGTLEIVRVEPRWTKARLRATDTPSNAGDRYARLVPPP